MSVRWVPPFLFSGLQNYGAWDPGDLHHSGGYAMEQGLLAKMTGLWQWFPSAAEQQRIQALDTATAGTLAVPPPYPSMNFECITPDAPAGSGFLIYKHVLYSATGAKTSVESSSFSFDPATLEFQLPTPAEPFQGFYSLNVSITWDITTLAGHGLLLGPDAVGVVDPVTIVTH
jgi:hypothetical protein